MMPRVAFITKNLKIGESLFVWTVFPVVNFQIPSLGADFTFSSYFLNLYQSQLLPVI